jgi:hypothetical protein
VYGGVTEFKKVYQIKTNFVKDEDGDLLVDERSILNGQKNYCCHLLNLNGVNDIRQTAMQQMRQLYRS